MARLCSVGRGGEAVSGVAYWQCLQTPEKDVESPGTADIGVYEPPCECWGLNRGPLEEQSVPLAAEASLQAPKVELSLFLSALPELADDLLYAYTYFSVK